MGEIVEAWIASGPDDEGPPRRFVERLKPLSGHLRARRATGWRYGPMGRIEAWSRSRPTCPRWSSSAGSRTSTASRRARRSRRPRPSTGTWSCSRSARAAGEAAASASRARSTGRCGTGASSRCGSRWRSIAKESKRVGLVGACVSDYPWIGDLMKMLEEHGVEVSISSLRADSLTEELVASLQRGGHRTLTMAPEAGTERLRRVIRKAITDEQIYEACDLLRRYGIPNLKCYFMIGLPTETREDVEAIPDLAARACSSGCACRGPTGKPFGKLTLSISSFVPKPWTPFQWAAFDDARALEAKLDIIKRAPAGSTPSGWCTRTRARPRCRPCWPAATGGWPTSSSWPRGLDGDWRRALREWDGDPAFFTPPRPRGRPRSCRGTTSTSG